MADVITVTEAKARLLATLELYDVQATTYPRQLTQLLYGEENLTDYVISLSFRESTAVVVCEVPHSYSRAPDRFPGDPLGHLAGQPLRGITDEGEKFEALAAHPVSFTFGAGFQEGTDRVTLTATFWQLTRSTPCLWAGRLQGGIPNKSSNVVLRVGTSGFGSFSRTHYGLLGSRWTYFLLNRKKKHLTDILVLDLAGAQLDYELLNNELQSMGFCLGRPIGCKLLIGLDESGQPVAYAGGSYGYDYLPQVNHEFAPVPEEVFTPWFTLLFTHLTRHLADRPPDDVQRRYLYEAMHLYVESATELYGSSREVKVLLSCQAMARWFTGREALLVRSPAAWNRWATTSPISRRYAHPEQDAVLREQLMDAAQPGPVALVRLALQAAHLAPHPELLAAVRESTQLLTERLLAPTYAETQDRCLRLRTLCAGLVAKAVGYQGPLAGWDMSARPNRYAEPPATAWYQASEQAAPVRFDAQTPALLTTAPAAELWPAFTRPSIPANSLISIAASFASNLAPRTGEQVRARVVPVPFFADEAMRLYDFMLQSLVVPLASTVLFTIQQTPLSTVLSILNWDEEVAPIVDEKALTSFLGQVARSPRTRHAIERLLLLDPDA